MTDPLMRATLAMFEAISALKLKKGVRIVSVRDGVELHQPGKPVLLLTREAAADFSAKVGEAEFG